MLNTVHTDLGRHSKSLSSSIRRRNYVPFTQAITNNYLYSAKAIENERLYEQLCLAHGVQKPETGQVAVPSIATEVLRSEALGADIDGVSRAGALEKVQKAIVDTYRKSPKSLTLHGWVRDQRIDHVTGKKQRECLVSRLIIAFFGGFALVAPMPVMKLHFTRLKTLLTTSICVVIVAVALAFYVDDAQPKDQCWPKREGYRSLFRGYFSGVAPHRDLAGAN